MRFSTGLLLALIGVLLFSTGAAQSSGGSSSSSSTGSDSSSGIGFGSSSSTGAAPPPPPGPAAIRDDHISVNYNGGYVVASYILATLGSGTSLQMMKQRSGLRGARNWLLLAGGAVALGAVGIFSQSNQSSNQLHAST
jgi:hypothetical protein